MCIYLFFGRYGGRFIVFWKEDRINVGKIREREEAFVKIDRIWVKIAVIHVNG